MLTVFLISLFMLLALGVPIFMSIGASGLTLFFAGTGSFAPNMMIQRMYSGLNSFTLMAIPLFMLAGEIMNRGQLSKKMDSLCKLYFRLDSRRIGVYNNYLLYVHCRNFGLCVCCSGYDRCNSDSGDDRSWI